MHRHLLLATAAVAVVALGCGGDGTRATGQPQTGANISGKVTYGGNVVGGGTVSVVSKADRSRVARGSIDATGAYSVKDAPVGEVVITVETETAKMFDPAASKGSAPPPGGPGVPNMKYVKIPAAYNNADTSKLTYSVKAGDQTHDIVLK